VVHLGHGLALIQEHLVVGGTRIHYGLDGYVLFRRPASCEVDDPKTAFSYALVEIVGLLYITDSGTQKDLFADFERFWP